MKSVDQGEIDLFLKRHEPVSSHEQFCAGELFDDWQITAFLGRGGGGEVYRVVNARNGAIAALKVFVRELGGCDKGASAARMRFENEMCFLSSANYSSFPHFIAQGEKDVRPWYVMELLENRNLPSDDAGVADFIVKISKCI